ncbi:MAG TPA: endolytic transglycosylase MltG [Candidatus Saccharimonadales bacterium]|nr:endolytic transglycosylase MltG [Candidatus Saccharimonadales bacterium]
MSGYRLDSKRRRRPGWLLPLIIILIIIGAGVAVVRVTYTNNLRPVSSSTKTVYFTVQSGWGVQQIAQNLHTQGLIRSANAFKNYVDTKELRTSLQAGTYVLSPSMSVQEIVNKMANGDVARNLLTILPGKRIDEIKQVFKQHGYSDGDLATAFDPASYLGDPAASSLPSSASLEGYLYPDSFQKITGTPAETIIKESLDEMGGHLTPAIVQGFADHGLSTYQGVTLASIVYQETDDPTYEPTVAQVFLKRLATGMPLQSNVTANYAADIAGVARNVNISSPYNTYLHKGLPPGPIGNMVDSALRAVAFPTNTNYLYFIAGDDGKIHFSHTEAEHEQAIHDFCQKKCAQ